MTLEAKSKCRDLWQAAVNYLVGYDMVYGATNCFPRHLRAVRHARSCHCATKLSMA